MPGGQALRNCTFLVTLLAKAFSISNCSGSRDKIDSQMPEGRVLRANAREVTEVVKAEIGRDINNYRKITGHLLNWMHNS